MAPSVQNLKSVWLGVFVGLVLFAGSARAASHSIVLAFTPNPTVFPLLLALDKEPDLPVRLMPVPGGEELDHVLRTGDADGAFIMTATLAGKVSAGAWPPMRLTDVVLWKGFSVVVPRDANVQNLADLRGLGVLQSGPTSGGKGGGPDLLFRAALKRVGLLPDDVRSCYMPVMVAVDWFMAGKPLGDHANCEPDKDLPATGLLLVEPATSGVVMLGRMPFKPAVEARLPLEPVFTGFTTWPAGELPLGGLAMRANVMVDRDRQAAFDRVRQAYLAAADDLGRSDHSAATRLEQARTIAKMFNRYFEAQGLTLGPLALSTALAHGSLLFKQGTPVALMQVELTRWLAELTGKPMPTSVVKGLP
jgi:hypothetical protein